MTSYRPVNTDEISLTAVRSNSDGTILVDEQAILLRDEAWPTYHTIVLTGTPPGIVGPTTVAFLKIDDNLSPPHSKLNTLVRVIHLSRDSPGIDIALTGTLRNWKSVNPF